MTVLFVTTNKGKVKNAQDALQPFGIRVKQVSVELAESRCEDPKDIALEKAKQAWRLLKKPVIVEDSGFFIDALGGFPMTHIKFSLKTLGIKNILKLLKGVKNRKAEWRMTVAYVYGPNKHQTFTFVEPGEITNRPRPVKRAMMSDLWRIFIPKMVASNKLALSEMDTEHLKVWGRYYETHNQFMMFGQWFAGQKPAAERSTHKEKTRA